MSKQLPHIGNHFWVGVLPAALHPWKGGDSYCQPLSTCRGGGKLLLPAAYLQGVGDTLLLITVYLQGGGGYLTAATLLMGEGGP